jgi:hypothetical protein
VSSVWSVNGVSRSLVKGKLKPHVIFLLLHGENL